ncbi:MAG TPA: hypothetical protein VGO71_05350 [Baekduia sp.]|nr:hypothetical protein [Baekduia sp.]
MKNRVTVLGATVLAVGASAAALAKDTAPAAAAAPRVACGTKVLYGKSLPLSVVGRGISCAEVRNIVSGTCRDGKTWSCFSFRAPDPLLVWFKSDERFAEHWSTTIEARRYPCTQAHVSAKAWARARRSPSSAFPSQQQVLADDLIRCGQLRGKTYKMLTALLGRPDEQSKQNGARSAGWQIGLERDSLFQVDSEYLSLRFGRDGVLQSADMTQG